MTSVTHMLEQSPLPKVVETLGAAIAEAQLMLDKRTIEVVRELQKVDTSIPGLPQKSMLELGFMPNFYHFSEATIIARVAFTSVQSQEFRVGAKLGLKYGIFSASVNASYSNKYSFTAEASSEIRTRIVSLPPPEPLAAIIQSAPRDTRRPTETELKEE
ncbi:hypothetical protein [Methyloterricola oryzae]|uniref:hypothetical protein n=1 Tax=Methyloterricola oryzae TaxID=1495050 RepID=UPI0005EBDDD0|nr:hypothetical protein [Methyloterricola oryzae]